VSASHYGSLFQAIALAVAIVIVVVLRLVPIVLRRPSLRAIEAAARIRQAQMAALAASLGLQFSPDDPLDVERRHAGFGSLFGRGSRRIYNVVHGRAGDCDVMAFDCRLSLPTAALAEDTGSAIWDAVPANDDSSPEAGAWGWLLFRRSRPDHTVPVVELSAVVVDGDVFFKPMFIRPEGAREQLAKAVGHHDITFESDEFNRQFYVEAKDKKFAYDVITPRVMQLLVANRKWNVDLFGRSIVVYDGRSLGTDEMKEAVEFAQQFLALMPDYLRQQPHAS